METIRGRVVLNVFDFEKLSEQDKEKVMQKIERALLHAVPSCKPITTVELELVRELDISRSIIKRLTESKRWVEKFAWARRQNKAK